MMPRVASLSVRIARYRFRRRNARQSISLIATAVLIDAVLIDAVVIDGH